MLRYAFGALGLCALIGFGMPIAHAGGVQLNLGNGGVDLSINFGHSNYPQEEVPYFLEGQPDDYYFYPRYVENCDCMVMVRPVLEYGTWVWYSQDGYVVAYGPWDPPPRERFYGWLPPYYYHAWTWNNYSYHRSWDGRRQDDWNQWHNWKQHANRNDWDHSNQNSRNDEWRTWSNQHHDSFVPRGGDKRDDWKQKNHWKGYDQNNRQNGNNGPNAGKPDKHNGQQQIIIPPKHEDKPKNWQNNQGNNQGSNNNQGRQNDNDHGKPDRGKPQGQPLPQGCSPKDHSKGKC